MSPEEWSDKTRERLGSGPAETAEPPGTTPLPPSPRRGAEEGARTTGGSAPVPGVDEPDDDLEDFEDWEGDYYYMAREDFAGLLQLRRSAASKNPRDLYAQIRLGEAYILNGQYEEAIELLAGHHRRRPEIPDFQHLILDALFALNKTEEDFAWVRKPRILRLGDEVLRECHAYLKPKKKPRTVEELHMHLLMRGYLCFTAEELLGALREDGRFIVSKANDSRFADSVFCEVTAAPKT